MFNGFLSGDTPNFVWKNKNALIDYGCIIENELPEIKAKPKVNPISVLGRSGEFHEWFGDYESYNMKVEAITIPYERISDVKHWLQGYGQLITHNDPDKYREAWAAIDNEMTFTNEWGAFYTFGVTFRCQPFRRKVGEVSIPLHTGMNELYDHGQEIAFPLFELCPRKKQEVVLTVNNSLFHVKDAEPMNLRIDCDKKIVSQGDKKLATVGKFPLLHPGQNRIILSSDIDEATILKRSVWL